MKKQVRAIMLPTEDKTGLWLNKVKTEIGYSYIPAFGTLKNNGLLCKYRHIYITSDEEIKEGNWYYSSLDNHVKQAKEYFGLRFKGSRHKIIGTSDDNIRHCKQCGGKQELNMDGVMQFTHINKCVSFSEPLLPNVSKSFLKAFIESGGKKDWEVEYEKESLLHIDQTSALGMIGKYSYKLKLDSENCVIFSAVEEKMYSGTDLMGNQDGSLDHFLLHSSKFSQEDREVIMDAVYDWIKENL